MHGSLVKETLVSMVTPCSNKGKIKNLILTTLLILMPNPKLRSKSSFLSFLIFTIETILTFQLDHLVEITQFCLQDKTHPSKHQLASLRQDAPCGHYMSDPHHSCLILTNNRDTATGVDTTSQHKYTYL